MKIYSNLRILGFCLILGVGVFPNSARAKKVALKWKEIPSAARYEIQVEKDAKPLFTKKVKEAEWEGDLGFGVYTYEIRAIDSAKRPGIWSDPRPLVVMPSKPELIYPVGEKVYLYSKNAGITLKWKEQSSVENYKVQISQKGKIIFQSETQGTQFDFRPPSEGAFGWKIFAIMKNKSLRQLASVKKEWLSPSSDEEEFNVKMGELSKPRITYPIGEVPPVSDKTITLKWKEVEGAQKYKVNLRKLASRSETEKLESFEAKENKLDVTVEISKKYSFDVQPVANVDSKNIAGALGPVSTAEFKVDPSFRFPDKLGYIAVSALYSPFDYEFSSPISKYKGSKSSKALAARISGEYFYQPNWGVGAAVQTTSMNLNGTNYTRSDFELNARYRMKLDNRRYGFLFYPKAGIESRQEIEVIPNQAEISTTGVRVISTKSISVRTLGPTVGFDLRRQINDKFSLGVKINYFYPLSLSGSSVTGLAGSKNQSNMNFGIQAVYWMNKRWSIGMGAFIDKRSVSFNRTESGATSTSPDEITMNANYFFGSLIYTFGK